MNSSCLSEQQIDGSKRLPDLASMIDTIGMDRLGYVIGQRLGSHNVHGTWVSLLVHYLEEDKGRFRQRDADCETHANQYISISLFVLRAIHAFVEYVCLEPDGVQVFCQYLEEIEKEIQKLNTEIAGDGFDEVGTAK